MACLFCEIAAGRIPAAVIYEDDHIIAFLDVCPIRTGHTQIIPKEDFAYFDELPAPILGKITELAQTLSQTMKQTFGVGHVAFLFTGGDVPHAHAHLIPMHEKTDITSRLYIEEEHLTFRSTPRVEMVELEKVAQFLKRA